MKICWGDEVMYAIAGGKVVTITGRVFDPGTVLFDAGKIIAVGSDISIPREAEFIDATGKYVLPGFIDAHCHVGIVEEVYREEGDDANEYTGPVNPHLRAIDAVDPADLAFDDALAGGVTTVITTPGSANVVGGEMVALKTSGTVVDDMIVRFPVGLKAALGENPKRVYGREKKTPATRMAAAALLREALVEAQEYMRKLELGEKDPAKQPDRSLKMESLVRVLKREIPLRIHAHRADDIMTAVRIAGEFSVKLVIEHCTEGYKVAQKLAEAGVPVVLGPILTNRAKAELKGISLENPRIMAESGVDLAIMTDHPVVPVQYLAVSAALAMKGGLKEEDALKAITINAARIAGLGDRLGSLEPGKDADVVIFDRHPFDFRTKVEKVFIGGRQVYPKS